jgi:hypothetical protein
MMKINFDKDFEKKTLTLFKKMIEENLSEVTIDEPFNSLFLIITDVPPNACMMSFKDEASGKSGYILSKNLNTKQ